MNVPLKSLFLFIIPCFLFFTSLVLSLKKRIFLNIYLSEDEGEKFYAKKKISLNWFSDIFSEKGWQSWRGLSVKLAADKTIPSRVDQGEHWAILQPYVHSSLLQQFDSFQFQILDFLLFRMNLKKNYIFIVRQAINS